jgi:uncharacterized Zn finger protein
LIFRLRGRTKEQIIRMLRARRTAPEAEAAVERPAAHKRAREEKIVPLKKCLDNFWEAAGDLEEFRVEIQAAPVDAAPVKRLGSPGFWQSKENFIGAFAGAYHSITQAALQTIHGVDKA